MRILLIQPAIEDFYSTPIRFYPLGLAYAAAVLLGRGHEVKLCDSLTPVRKKQRPIPAEMRYLSPFFQQNPYLFKRYYRFGAEDIDLVRAAALWQPDLIGISSQFTAYFRQTANLATALHRQLHIPIFLGGHHATAFSREVKEQLPFLHQVLCGPAESALPGYMHAFDKQGAEPVDWRCLQPAHGLLNVGAYRVGKKYVVSLTASRGCPFQCDFCSVHAMFGSELQYRPIASVLEEMRWNYRFKQVRVFNFEDDNLAWKRDWFLQLLHEIQNDPLLCEIELTAMNGMCHAALDEELLVQMKAAGFKDLNLSFVTQDRAVQQQHHRPSQRNFSELVATGQALGFFITAYVIIGLPEQTYDEVKESIDYLLDLGVLVGPSVFYIPPASRLYERLIIDDAVRRQWSLYRSSAFAVETEHLSRSQLVELFAYARQRNLQRRGVHFKQ